MRKLIGLAALCATVMLSACDSPDADQSASAETTTPPMEVTAQEISAAFQENEVKAKLTYDDKVLLVSGTIKNIELDFMDNPVVKLAGANDFMDTGVSEDGKMTDVSISGLSKEVSANLSKGAKLMVKCSDIAEAMGSAMLDDCEVVQ